VESSESVEGQGENSLEHSMVLALKAASLSDSKLFPPNFQIIGNEFEQFEGLK
jgi:hypothetical protein